MEDIAGFLGSHPPFDAVDADELARLTAVTETEVTLRGKAIFAQGAGPVESVWVVRSGSVEVIHDGRVLDLLGPGELFGHASMISGLPTGFEARAAQDTVCYRIPADVIRPLLARPDVLRFVARSIVNRTVPAAAPPEEQVRVATLIRTPPLLCQGTEPIREAARRMTEEGASAVLVPLPGSFGIVTDRDLRRRVIVPGLSPDAPVSSIMTAPAYTVTADRLGGDVLLDMLERNVHHIPVLSAAGQVLGVVDDGDLVAADGRKPLLLRLLARFALSFRPPTGLLLRDFVVEHSGERRGQLDLKHGGMIPIDDQARWAGMAAGVASASTRERLRAAEAAGTMDRAEAQTLTEAFGFIFSLRLDHQVEQLRHGWAEVRPVGTA